MFSIFGFAQGFQPLVAYNFGRRNFTRITQAFRLSLIAVTIYSIILNLLYIVFSTEIVKIFSQDPEVIKLGESNLFALNIFFFTFGITTIVTTLYQSLGKGRDSFILASCRNGFFFIPLIYILGYFFQLDGIIASNAVADLLAGLFTIYYILKIRRELKTYEFSEKAAI
jgi:Na+-driven multidrug efflux pump